MTKVQQEIKRLLDKYSSPDNKKLFKLELEYLTGLANKEGFIEAGEKLVKNWNKHVKK